MVESGTTMICFFVHLFALSKCVSLESKGHLVFKVAQRGLMLVSVFSRGTDLHRHLLNNFVSVFSAQMMRQVDCSSVDSKAITKDHLYY